jgi:adenosine/AMP kinase
VNVIAGQAHFIEAVEDLHEALAGAGSHLRFGIAFCEASACSAASYLLGCGTVQLTFGLTPV